MSELDDLLDLILADPKTSAGETVTGPAWQRLVDAQLTSVGLAEKLGGAGGDFRDACTILARCGEAALSVPIAEMILVTAAVASRFGVAIPTGVSTVAFASPAAITVSRPSSSWRLRGSVRDVAWASQADVIFVVLPSDDATIVAGLVPGEYAVAAGANLAGEARDLLTFDASLQDDRVHIGAASLVEDLRLLASFGRTCQVAGLARRATSLAIDYAGARKQFGRPIGDQQIIAHMLVEMTAETAATDACIAAAIGRLALSADGRPGSVRHVPFDVAQRFTVAAARVQAARAAEVIARHAHQVHGAIGTAAEHPLHHLTLRLWSWPYEYGDPRAAAIDLSRLLLRRGDLWELLTDPVGPEPDASHR